MEIANMKNGAAAVTDGVAGNRNMEDTDSGQLKPKVYPKGWRLHTLTAG